MTFTETKTTSERLPTLRERVVEILADELRCARGKMSSLNPYANDTLRDIAVACVASLEALGRTADPHPMFGVKEDNADA